MGAQTFVHNSDVGEAPPTFSSTNVWDFQQNLCCSPTTHFLLPGTTLQLRTLPTTPVLRTTPIQPCNPGATLQLRSLQSERTGRGDQPGRPGEQAAAAFAKSLGEQAAAAFAKNRCQENTKAPPDWLSSANPQLPDSLRQARSSSATASYAEDCSSPINAWGALADGENSKATTPSAAAQREKSQDSMRLGASASPMLRSVSEQASDNVRRCRSSENVRAAVPRQLSSMELCLQRSRSEPGEDAQQDHAVAAAADSQRPSSSRRASLTNSPFLPLNSAPQEMMFPDSGIAPGFGNISANITDVLRNERERNDGENVADGPPFRMFGWLEFDLAEDVALFYEDPKGRELFRRGDVAEERKRSRFLPAF